MSFVVFFFFFKQKTAYEMRISDWSSDVCSSDLVLVAIGQENAFPWIERDIGLTFNRWGLPELDEVTFQSSLANVFFGGDSAFGPKNIIWAVRTEERRVGKECVSKRSSRGSPER